MAFSVNRSEIGSNRRTVTLMAIASLVKAETYASARCRVSVSCRLQRHHRWDSRAIAGLGGFLAFAAQSIRKWQKSYIFPSVFALFRLIFSRAMSLFPKLANWPSLR
jgi:hypothetical protein